MGLAAGGRMRQVIHPDPFKIDDWDVAAADRVFVTLLHAKDWRTITGDAAPNQPPTAKEYSKARFPWFDYYSENAEAIAGSPILGALDSVVAKGNKNGEVPLPENASVEPGVIVNDLRRRITVNPGVVEVGIHGGRVIAPDSEICNRGDVDARLLRELRFCAVLVQARHRKPTI